MRSAEKLSPTNRLERPITRATLDAMIHASLERVLVVCGLTASLTAQGMVIGAATSAWANAGDVNGDGLDDTIVRVIDPTSGFLVYRVLDSATGSPMPSLDRPATFGTLNLPAVYDPIGDCNDDGCGDLLYQTFSSGEILSGADGSSLLPFAPGPAYPPVFADFDGDGRSDRFDADATGVGIVSGRTGLYLFHIPQAGSFNAWIEPIGDENGDGREDAAIMLSEGDLWLFLVRENMGQAFGPWFRTSAIGDVTGDGRVDFLSRPLGAPASILVGGSLTSVGAFTMSNNSRVTPTGDVDGDGCADFVLTAPERLISGATHALVPGAAGATQRIEPMGDPDGDGRNECFMGGFVFEWDDPSVPVASRMARRGRGGLTSDARRATLATRGHCGLGHTAFFDMRGCLPNGLALLVHGGNLDVDLSGLGAPGNRCYTSLLGGLAFVANANGIAQYQATVPTSPSLLGATLSLQSIVVDPAANALGLVTSNAVDITTN